jgi:hypothetical protein
MMLPVFKRNFVKRWSKHAPDIGILSFKTILKDTAFTTEELTHFDEYRTVWKTEITDPTGPIEHVRDLAELTRTYSSGGVEMIKCSNDYLIVYHIGEAEYKLSIVGFYNYCYRLFFEYGEDGLQKLRKMLMCELSNSPTEYGAHIAQMAIVLRGIGEAVGLPALVKLTTPLMGYYKLNTIFLFSANAEGFFGYNFCPVSMCYYLFSVSQSSEVEIRMPMLYHDIKALKTIVIREERTQNCIIYRAMEPYYEEVLYKEAQSFFSEEVKYNIEVVAEQHPQTNEKEFYINRQLKLTVPVPESDFFVLEENMRKSVKNKFGNRKKKLDMILNGYRVQAKIETMMKEAVPELEVQLHIREEDTPSRLLALNVALVRKKNVELKANEVSLRKVVNEGILVMLELNFTNKADSFRRYLDNIILLEHRHYVKRKRLGDSKWRFKNKRRKLNKNLLIIEHQEELIQKEVFRDWRKTWVERNGKLIRIQFLDLNNFRLDLSQKDDDWKDKFEYEWNRAVAFCSGMTEEV